MDNYTEISFWVTIIGTLVGIASLIYAMYISKTAKSIKSTLLSVHMQRDFKKTKKSLLIQLSIAYKLIEENDIIEDWKILEALVDLGVYKKILSKDTHKLIRKIHKLIDKKKKIILFKISRKKRNEDNLRLSLYELISELEKDFKEKENLLEVIIK